MSVHFYEHVHCLFANLALFVGRWLLKSQHFHSSHHNGHFAVRNCKQMHFKCDASVCVCGHIIMTRAVPQLQCT